MQQVDLIPELHKPFAEFIQMNPWDGGPPESLRKLAWMPRGHFKSSIISVAYPLWLLCRDRNTSIALISSKEDNTKQWVNEIKQTITNNLFFQWAFPEIVRGPKWDENRITIKRDRDFGINTQASITAYTIKGGLASAHHPHIILDDPLNEQSAFSETEREKAIGLYVHLESIISKYSESMFTVVGTPWPGYDVIQHAMEHEVAYNERIYWGIGALGGWQGSDILKENHPETIPHIEERVRRDGVIFHEVCPLRKLEKIKRQDLNQYIYQYLCTRPEDSDNGFKVSLFRDFALEMDGTIKCDCHKQCRGTGTHELKNLVVVAICDPALTVTGQGCESAIAVVGRDPMCGCRFLLQEWGGHVSNRDLVDKICEVSKKWTPYIKRFAIEDVHFQTVFKAWLTERKSHGDFPLGVELFGVKPKRRDKDLRIEGQQAYVSNGYWHKRPEMAMEQGKERFLWQLHKWPSQPKKRDRIDAWAYCDDVWEGLSVANASPEDHKTNPLRAQNRRMARRDIMRIKKAQGA
jgi:hypothetical protein